MTNNIAKCGCDCFSCPTYKDNLKTMDDRVECSSGWIKNLGIRLSPEKLKACYGCSISDSQRKTYYLNCRVRKCAMDNGFQNCAYCKGFPCEELLEVHSLQKIKDRSDFIKKTGKVISDLDYNKFIEPYTGLSHLIKIRQELSDNELNDYKKYSLKKALHTSEESICNDRSNQIIYSLLSNICVEENISYARFITLSARRKKLMKILWVIGCYGTFNKAAGHLELDSQTFRSHKIISMYKELTKLIDDLIRYDIRVEIIPTLEKEWLTPSGGLKREGWIIRLSFGSSFPGNKNLQVFTNYISLLTKKYGSKAFRYFNRVDMDILTK